VPDARVAAGSVLDYTASGRCRSEIRQGDPPPKRSQVEMSVLVHVSFVGAFIFYLAMVFLNDSHPPTGGEKAILHALGMVAFSTGFFACIAVLTFSLHSIGRLNWIANDSGMRAIVLVLVVISLAVTFFFSAALKWEEWHDVPVWVTWLSKNNGMIWIPLLALVPVFLLMLSREQPTPSLLLRTPLIVMCGICVLFTSGLAISWLRVAAEKQRMQLEAVQQRNDEQHEDHLRTIDELSLEDDVRTLLPFTGPFQDEDVREAALKKLKARSHWEDEVLAVLNGERGYSDAYYFIDGNLVADRKRFAEALERSIGRMAVDIRTEVQQTDNMQEWTFEWYRPERALAAIDFQFSDVGVDFVSAVGKLLSALNDDRPERFKNIKVKAAGDIEH